jgi:hypothetical protein
MRRALVRAVLAAVAAFAADAGAVASCLPNGALCEGDLLVANGLTDNIVRVQLPGAQQTVLASGLVGVAGVASDPHGFVYFTDAFPPVRVRRVDLTRQPPQVETVALDPNLSVPRGIVFDPVLGELLVAEAGNQGIARIDPVSGALRVVYRSLFLYPEGLGFPQGLALEPPPGSAPWTAPSGTLYISDSATVPLDRPTIYRLDLAGRRIVPVSRSGLFGNPKDVARHPDGYLIVADRTAGAVFRVDPRLDATLDPASDPPAALCDPEQNQVVLLQTPAVSGPEAVAVLEPPDILLPGPADDFNAGVPVLAIADLTADVLRLFSCAHPGSLSDGSMPAACDLGAPSACGALLATIGGANFDAPRRVAVVGPIAPPTPSDALVVDAGADAVQTSPTLYRLSPVAGDPLQVDRAVAGDGFGEPVGVGQDPTDDSLVLTDAMLPSLRDADGQTLYDGPHLEHPQRVAVDHLGDYLVADPDLGPPALLRILRTGSPPASQVEVVTEGGHLVEPVALAIDPDGILYVANRDASAESCPVIKVNPAIPGMSARQQPLCLFDDGEPLDAPDPVDIALDRNGDILLAERSNVVVIRVDPVTGEVGKSYQDDSFADLRGISLDPSDRQLVVTLDPAEPEGEPRVFRIDTGGDPLRDDDVIDDVAVTGGGGWLQPEGVCVEDPALAAPGDPAETDPDHDWVGAGPNSLRPDNCPEVENPTQADFDQNGRGNVCNDDFDEDADEVEDSRDVPGDGLGTDNCPLLFNPDQRDSDMDGQGEVCDPDANPDGDAHDNDADNCPFFKNDSQADQDGDGFGDPCDRCPANADPGQEDGDLDFVGDLCDNCPGLFNPRIDTNADGVGDVQPDADGDGVGDACNDAGDADGDEWAGALDNCPGVANPGQQDFDEDGTGDACNDAADPDGDEVVSVDGVPDNCPLHPNPQQTDGDADGMGDACDPDADPDADGVPNAADNCDATANAGQQNSDADSFGNACDNCPQVTNEDQANADGDSVGDACNDANDPDGDEFVGGLDNCQGVANPGQEDTDGNDVGDACNDAQDADGDDWADTLDNCPNDANPEQADADGDDVGDRCDPDFDWDGDLFKNGVDNCPATHNATQFDDDRDGLGNVCDNCPDAANPGQEDFDEDGTGDACDSDADPDGDAVPNAADNCDANANAGQQNSDADSFGDACDNCPQATNEGQQDSDGDGVGDACNDDAEDADGDEVADALDNCPNDANQGQEDRDLDWVPGVVEPRAGGDACDSDDDGDFLPDADDNCVLEPNLAQGDADMDGYGDVCDSDFDGDGIVGNLDYLMLLGAYGSQPGSPNHVPGMDIGGNGIFSPEYLQLLARFGRAPGPSGLVP